MKDGVNSHNFLFIIIYHSKWETSHKPAPEIQMNDLIASRTPLDLFDASVYARQEFLTQSNPSLFIPTVRIADIVKCFGSNDQFIDHTLFERFALLHPTKDRKQGSFEG